MNWSIIFAKTPMIKTGSRRRKIHRPIAPKDIEKVAKGQCHKCNELF